VTKGSSPDRRRIAVIIPYYQRDEGILSRAVESVRAQDLPPSLSVHTYVIDDASPHPAGAELDQSPDVTVIAQENGGPGAARNTGLDQVFHDGGADFVAFLDSDDIWSPEHLARAVAALDQGYDFYCCDHARTGDYALYSEENPVLLGRGTALADRSTLIDTEGPVRGFAPMELCDEIAIHYLSHTSSVVVRADLVGTQRFDPDLRSAGEDRMFWLDLSLSGARIVISWKCNVTCGSGINLFFASHDWDSPSTIEKFASQLLFSQKMLLHENMSVARNVFAENRARNCRRAYAYLFVRSFLKGRVPPMGSFKRLLSFDPILPLKMPFLFLGVVLDRRPPEHRLQAE